MIDCFIKNPFAELQSDDGLSKLKICTLGYEFPNIKNGWDADWQKNFIYLSIPGFKAEIEEVVFEGKILETFISELKKFLKLNIENVQLRPREPCINLDFSFNGRKKVIVEGFIQYPIGPGASLEFEFETDLTYIEKFIQEVEDILLVYPSRR